MPPIRTMRPLYVDRLPPCNHACPAGENVQAWLAEAQAGRYREAWEIIVRDNPMPAVHGRVCYHPCEDACNRKDVDEAVSIHAVERFLGDMALSEGWTVAPDEPPSDQRVLVVGAGPSGLSAAWHLARRGHEVVIYEAGPMAGGMMHFGIPKYRLPREVLDGEIERIRSIGVEIVLNHKVDDLVAEKTDGRFDAVFLAVGAHLSKRQDIPARDAGKVYDALQFLKDVEAADQSRASAGASRSTAAATRRWTRRARRRGSARSRSSSTAARASRCRRTTSRPTRRSKKASRSTGCARSRRSTARRFTVEVMRLDENRYPVPTGEFETLEADSVILALGQDTDTAFLKNVPGIDFKNDGTVVVGPRHADRLPGRVRGRRHGAVRADGHDGRRSRQEGRAAHRRLAAQRRRAASRPKHEIATFEMLRLWYHAEAKKRGQSTIDIERRRQTFDEVVAGLDRPRRATRRSAACRAATASSATAASRRAPSRPSSSWARAGATSTTSTGAPAARSATTSARAARSR